MVVGRSQFQRGGKSTAAEIRNKAPEVDGSACCASPLQMLSSVSIDRKDLKCVVVVVRSVHIEFPRKCISVNQRNCTYAFPRRCISTFYT